LKEVLLIDCGNYNSITTIQINYIKCLLRENFKIFYIIFKDNNKIDKIKYQRWPQHENLFYLEVNASNRLYQILRRLIGDALINYFLLRSILNRFHHAICFEYYSALPAYLHSILNKNFKFQVASLELYDTKSWLIKKAFQTAKLITTQDELRKEQIEKYFKLPTPSNVVLLYNTSLSFEEIPTDKVDVPSRIQDQKKILFIGSLISEHCIEDVIDWIEKIPENFCIIFHGWGLTEFNRNRIQISEKLWPNKVWLSDLILDETEKWKMYNVADYGIVMFSKTHRNNEFAGLSAGKLFDFIRLGVPVIVSDTMLLSSFTSNNNLGKASNGDIKHILNEINQDIDIKDIMNKFYFDVSFTGTVCSIL
jgi:hypothetical protein